MNCSASRATIKSAPIKKFNIDFDKTTMGKKPFSKALDVLTPGDIFTLTESRGYLDDGIYLVNSKDNTNKGIGLTKFEPDGPSPLHTDNCLVTADDVEGTVEIAGSLNIVA